MAFVALGAMPTVVAIEWILMPAFAQGGGCQNSFNGNPSAFNNAREHSQGKCFHP